ncbi:MAG: photosystem I reaction center subunit VIII [Synechococcales cyanobacterium RU_4_20]|nr:photosystem I reaction center subunit VIII [Synechococcales cyanobacterium RU_4_20]NJR68656.1 photosystem I reaction center subunit VIII [Synechococcales cyanobacterium CRU_2_2]
MSASFLPAIFVPLSAIAAFVAMGLFFLYVEADA